VRGGLALKKAGNDLMRVLGGREIHPVNVRSAASTGCRVAPSSPVAEA
jgi:sulfhydrogenase subunit alpha